MPDFFVSFAYLANDGRLETSNRLPNFSCTKDDVAVRMVMRKRSQLERDFRDLYNDINILYSMMLYRRDKYNTLILRLEVPKNAI